MLAQDPFSFGSESDNIRTKKAIYVCMLYETKTSPFTFDDWVVHKWSPYKPRFTLFAFAVRGVVQATRLLPLLRPHDTHRPCTDTLFVSFFSFFFLVVRFVRKCSLILFLWSGMQRKGTKRDIVFINSNCRQKRPNSESTKEAKKNQQTTNYTFRCC